MLLQSDIFLKNTFQTLKKEPFKLAKEDQNCFDVCHIKKKNPTEIFWNVGISDAIMHTLER